jgi:hypothetical protein
MRFKTDENLPIEVAEFLAQKGYPSRPGGQGADNDGGDRGGGCQRVRAKEILRELLCGLHRPASRPSRVG